jgi:putative spermidine/putrescine transport system substrate-binding protein
MDRKLWKTGKVVGLVVLCVFTLALLAQAQEKKVVVSSWGGDYEKAFKKAVADPFEKEKKIKVIVTSYPDFAKMKAMVDSKNIEWDVVDIEDRDLKRGIKAGLFEALDYNVIDKKDILPEMVNPYGVGMEYWAGVLAYSKKKFPSGNHPKSWADFWDVKKFPGKRALYNNPYMTLEIALMADGVPKDKIYPIDVDRAFKSLDKIKPHISVWWTKGGQPPQLLTDGEVDMTYAYSGRIAVIKKDGVAADIVWNQGLLNPEWLVVMKGSKNKKEAMQLVAYATQPKPQAVFNEAMNYGPINKKAWDHINLKAAPDIPNVPANVANLVTINGGWWADNEAKVLERWTSWIIK